MNAFTIGAATVKRRNGEDTRIIQIIDDIILLIYTVELAMRLYAFGPCRFLRYKANWLDVFLVLFGLVETLVTYSSSNFAKNLGNMMLIRVLRILKVVRVLRLFLMFETLWLLVQGLINSIVTLAWTFVLLAVLLYLFAIVALEVIITDNDAPPEYNWVVEEHFRSLETAVLSLYQGFFNDGFSEIYRPIILFRPQLAFYFLPFMLLVSMALMNLVTSIMVQNAHKMIEQNKERKSFIDNKRKLELINRLKELFTQMDVDNSCTLRHAEILNAPQEVRDAIAEVIDSNDDAVLNETLRMLDTGGDGEIDLNEFCDGLARLGMNNGKPIELFFIGKYCEEILDKTRGLMKSSKKHLKAMQDLRKDFASSEGAVLASARESVQDF